MEVFSQWAAFGKQNFVTPRKYLMRKLSGIAKRNSSGAVGPEAGFSFQSKDAWF